MYSRKKKPDQMKIPYFWEIFLRIIHAAFYHDSKSLLQQYTRRLPYLCIDSGINKQLVFFVCLFWFNDSNSDWSDMNFQCIADLNIPDGKIYCTLLFISWSFIYFSMLSVKFICWFIFSCFGCLNLGVLCRF